MSHEDPNRILFSDFVGWWDYNSRRYPDRVALIDDSHRLTWGKASGIAGRLAAALLALGLKPGDVVASWLPHWVESYIVHAACEHAGLAWLPIPEGLRAHEVRAILERAEAQAIFVTGQRRDMNYAETICQMRAELPNLKHVIGVRLAEKKEFSLWDRLLQREQRDLSEAGHSGPLILPTSGSTGTPKFAYFTASSWLLRGRLQAELFRLGPEDVLLAMAQGIGPSIPPLFAAPIAGSGVVFMGRMEIGEIFDLIEKEKVTVACAVPAQLASMVYNKGWEPKRYSTVRLWYTTGATMPRTLAEKIERETGAIVLSGYGGMDFGGWTVPSLDDPPEIRHRTVGVPRGGTEIRLVDDQGHDVPQGEIGEIWGRGPCCALGYYKDEESTRERWTSDGWFRTGDLGRLDPRGNLVIVGRKKEIIRRGAQTVVPAEIELLLMAHPKVLKAAVIGLPDLVMDERACACVLPRPGESFSFEEMVEFLKARQVAPYKWPERLELFGDMPLRGDKIDKDALRNAVLERMVKRAKGAT